MKKVLIIGGSIIAVIVILIVVLSFSSKKLVCKSAEGNITLMYSDKAIVGYTTNNLTYDMDGQNEYAKEIGMKAYLDEFSTWFSINTTGTCEKK